MRGFRIIVVARCALVAGLAGGAAAGVGRAQQSVPIVEPQYVRVFGSDSLYMYEPAFSPDGRWVVFTRFRSNDRQADLWIVSAAGGAPTRLTSGPHSDQTARWFPSSDRLAFLSDRPSVPGQPPQLFVMTLPIDRETGQPTGAPRQASLEGALDPTVSPDGRQIAYIHRADSTYAVKVIPAVGGSDRRVAEFVNYFGGLTGLVWSGDGEYLYFVRRMSGSRSRVISRVPARGGRTEELGTVSWRVQAIAPTGRHVISTVEMGPGQPTQFELGTTTGRVLARITPPRNMFPFSFTPDGRGFAAVLNNVAAPIRVVPVAGGPGRQLTEAREYDWPFGWSGDGARVFIETRLNGEGAVLAAPASGAAATSWTVPREARHPFQVSRDGRYAVYATGASGGDAGTLVVRRLADGVMREVTRNLFRLYGPQIAGPGGPSGCFDSSFYYTERRGERLELWEAAPEGAPRLLAAIPARHVGRTGFGVYQQRVVYTERRGDSTTVYLVDRPNGPGRRLLAWPGQLDSPVWSRAGRWLAFDHYPAGENPRYSVLVVGIGANGTVSVAPRLLDTGSQWGWWVQWMPNDEAVTVFGMTGVGLETHVFLVPLREGERPVAITRDDPSIRWGYELSPDGRYVAYPAEVPRGSSIWRVDLGDVIASAGREAGRRQP